MTLYSADVLDIAKPVATKGKGKKAAAALAPIEEVKEEVEVKKEEDVPGKMKKAPTEKQLAALKRAQEMRQRKREEAAAAAAEKERLEQERLDQERQKEEAATAKKEAAKLKRKLAREEKKGQLQQLATPATTESIGSVEEEIEAGIRAPVAKKVRIDPHVDGPPSWFTQYVAGVKKEEAKLSKEKKPQRQIKQEAMDVAEHQWNDGFTRDRVRNEVDNHMSRMYQMMFSGRRLK